MMKKLLCVFVATLFFIAWGTAQENNPEGIKGFDRNKIFIGSSINLGLSNNFFNLGFNPEVGYSLNNWLDAGFVVNFNYYTQSANFYKDKNLNYGGGAFLRVWPLPFLHLQLQPEYNWIRSDRNYTNGSPTDHFRYQAPSLLGGIGYGSRVVGSRFSHFTIMIDLNQAFNSPYRDQFGDPQPVFRGGFGFYLNPKKK